ncbi:MAG: hypothetical protein ACR2KB_12715 [Chitinophagaceae bacterium]
MKQIYLAIFLAFVLVHCKKEDAPKKDAAGYLQTVQSTLKDSLSSADFASLEFNKAELSAVDSIDLFLLRIPVKGKSMRTDFVLVKTTKTGKILNGKIINMQGGAVDYREGDFIVKKWDGAISIYSLNRRDVLHSPIRQGYITAFHEKEIKLSTESIALVAPDNYLPEVIVVGYIKTGGISYLDYMALQNLTSDFTGGSYQGYYLSMDGSYGSGGSSPYYYDPYGTYNYSGGGGGGGVYTNPPILIDFEWHDQRAAIDLQQFVNCFNAIPDAGATCSIEIFADIPVDSDPMKIFNMGSGSPGHTFLQIKKSNGGQSVIQNIGFYPQSVLKTVLTNAPIASKFVDNGGHEYNASFKMKLSPENLKSTLTEILYLRNMKYDIDNYNCTDWALDVFNKTRPEKVSIPLSDIPGTVPSVGTRTPQGLYNKLGEMKRNNHPEAAQITNNIYKGWVATSTGPCN